MNEEILEIKNLLENRVQLNWSGIDVMDLESLDFAITNEQNFNFYPSSFAALRNDAGGIIFVTNSESEILKSEIII